jgi:putative transposase
MIQKFESAAHSKHLILYHIIFVSKFRRKLFLNQNFSNSLKSKFLDISKKYEFRIESLEIDPTKPDHVHFLIRSIPKLSPAQIVRVLKQESNIWCWKHFNNWLSQFYWDKKLLWTRGYFCSSVGNVSTNNLIEYLERQSKEVISA